MIVVREERVSDDDCIEWLYAKTPNLDISVNLSLEGFKGPFGNTGLYGRYLQQEDRRYKKQQKAGQDAENYVL